MYYRDRFSVATGYWPIYLNSVSANLELILLRLLICIVSSLLMTSSRFIVSVFQDILCLLLAAIATAKSAE